MPKKNIKKEVAKNKKPKYYTWIYVGGIIIFVPLFCFIGLVAIYEYKYQDRIFPNILIGEINVGGATQDQALKMLQNRKEAIIKNGLVFTYSDKKVAAPAVMTATDPDLAKTILSFDLSQSVAQAYQLGRNQNFTVNLFDQFKLLTRGGAIDASYFLDDDELTEILKINFRQYEAPAQDAALKIKDDKTAVVIPEKSGVVFNFDTAINQAKKNLSALRYQPIELEFNIAKPKILASETADALAQARKIISTSTPVLFYGNKSWPVPNEQAWQWLEFYRPEYSNDVAIHFNYASTTEFLATIAKTIDIKPQDAKFTLKDNRVVEFLASHDGKELDMEKTYEKINSEFLTRGNPMIELIVAVAPASIPIADSNNLGIKELIGTGQSNFAGSPKNRRHNIAVGAGSLNGILIAAGEEFSLLKALGPVDGEHGYLPELVIKGNRTIPEFGGGLCQIGTTAFRAALYSGLPITQRRNHSYRVTYYEPAGMDATIYDPAPDFRFLNDTGAYILFTTRIEGNDLFFEFYGNKDGRTVVIDPNPPKKFNITSSGEPKYIETQELAPGEKKLVEHAHAGADTVFDYRVTYPDGTIKENKFASHYVAWPEVWLVGVDKPATSTDAAIESILTPAP